MTGSEETGGTVDPERVDAARQLILIARDLRTAGDLHYVLLSAEGISDYPVTLAGQLELIAMQLDWSGCMKGASIGPDDDPQSGRPVGGDHA